jgi:hypothetical protein
MDYFPQTVLQAHDLLDERAKRRPIGPLPSGYRRRLKQLLRRVRLGRELRT